MTTSPATPESSDPLGPGRRSWRARTVRGFAWTGGQAIVNRLLSLAGFVALSRLLEPRDYGLAALAAVFLVAMTPFAAAGFSQALVQRSSVDKTDLDTLFWIAIGTSLFLAGVLVLASWPLADLYGEPKLRGLLQALSLNFIAIGASSTHVAVLQRRLAFRSIAYSTIVANVIATIVGVSFALDGFGAWALVIQMVLGQTLTSIGIIARSGYRPGFSVSWSRFRELFRSSRHFLGIAVMKFGDQRTDDLLIGTVLGSVALGIYTVAYRTLLVMTDVLITTTQQVAFPVFSRLQNDRRRLAAAYQSAIRIASAITAPLFLFTFAAAPEIIRVVFSSKWDASAPIMRMLCLYGAQQGVMQFNVALLQAVGRARTVFRLALLGTIAQVIAFAATVHFGIFWVAVSYVARSYIVAPIGLTIAARELGTTSLRSLSGMVGPLVATGVMVGGVFAAKGLMPEGWHAVGRLAVLIPVAVGCYFASLRLASPRTLGELLDLVWSGRRGSAVTVPG